MTSHHDRERARELLASYVLGDLGPEERALVEGSLGDPEVERELFEWHRVLAGVAEGSSSPIAPSAHLRQRVLREVRREAALHARPLAASRWLPGLLAAGLVLAVLFGGYRVRELERRVRVVETERATLQAEVAQAVAQLATTEERVIRLAQAMQLVNAPDTRLVRLARLELERNRGSAAAFVHPDGHAAIFYAYDLAPAPLQHDYQLWYIAGGVPVSAGVFEVDGRGNALVQVADLPDIGAIETWAVTIEPEGGVPQPTGPMVLAGTAS